MCILLLIGCSNKDIDCTDIPIDCNDDSCEQWKKCKYIILEEDWKIECDDSLIEENATLIFI